MQGHGRLVAPPSHASTHRGPCVNGETTWSMALCIRSRILNLPLSLMTDAGHAVCAPPRPVRLVVEYDGSAFAGYQSQSGCRTVQDALEVCVCVWVGVGLPLRPRTVSPTPGPRAPLSPLPPPAQEALARLPGGTGSSEWRTIAASRTDKGVHAR
jgi:hypothetical protein